jgi:hypothetical protein
MLSIPVNADEASIRRNTQACSVADSCYHHGFNYQEYFRCCFNRGFVTLIEFDYLDRCRVLEAKEKEELAVWS